MTGVGVPPRIGACGGWLRGRRPCVKVPAGATFAQACEVERIRARYGRVELRRGRRIMELVVVVHGDPAVDEQRLRELPADRGVRLVLANAAPEPRPWTVSLDRNGRPLP
jgi:hypothetical protein